MMDCIANKKKILMIFTSVWAGLSTVLLVLSIASEHWLRTKELYKGPVEELSFLPENFTGSIYIYTNFGLWRSCQKFIDKDDVEYKDNKCKNIPYKDLSEESESEDTILAAIISNCRKTTIFPLLSLMIEIIGDILCLLGYCFGKRRHLVFVTGVLFVVSGMSLLIGNILFMGAVTGDANHQPTVAKDEIPIFRYSYGPSFVMMATSFCLDEICGVLSVYLFIIRHKQSVKKKHAKLRAFKSKTDHIQSYFKRKSRNHTQSLSSNGDLISRRSSYMPVSQDAPPPPFKDIERDNSRFTLMTTVESHHHLTAAHQQPRCSITPEIQINDHVVAQSNELGEPATTTMIEMILPPGEFRTGSIVKENGESIERKTEKRNSRCKTTDV